MNRLNYFNSYRSIDESYENHLTRGFLVLLRFSPLLTSMFYDLCKRSLETSVPKGSTSVNTLPFLFELPANDWNIETQLHNPTITSEFLLSVLLTNERITTVPEITPVDRNAIYDGVVTLGESVTLIIENKPRASNVWDLQLSPSKYNLSTDTTVVSYPAVVQWKDVISLVTNLLSSTGISLQEKHLFEDFLQYVDEHYAYLNPYHKFSLCKGNRELLHRRIKTVLESIVTDPNLVKDHRGWGYYIESPLPYLKQIGLIQHDKEDGDWYLELSLFAGDSQSQAISLYSSDGIKLQSSFDWKLRANFHFAFRSQNLIWFESEDLEKYINFWTANVELIHQYNKADIEDFIQLLVDNEVIIYSEEKQMMLYEKFMKTKMSKLNCCPGVGALLHLSSADAINLDDMGNLTHFLADKIQEGLSFFGETLPIIKAPGIRPPSSTLFQ